MKVLIMSVTAGEGHNSTARAMKSYFDAHGTECSILDTYRYVSPAVAKLISEGYLLVSDKVKVAFGAWLKSDAAARAKNRRRVS